MKIFFIFATLLFRLYTPKFNYDYPEVRRDESQVEDYHGTLVKDPYRWLEDLESSETKGFVAAQNRLTMPYLRQCVDRNAIRTSLTNLMNHTKFGTMKKRGGRYFFTQSEGLQNQMSLFTQNELNGVPRLLLDPNSLSSEGTTSITSFFPSPDGKVLGYKLSKKGSDWQTIHFMHVESGIHFKDQMPDTKFTSLSWTLDGKGIFYTKFWIEKIKNKNGTEDVEKGKRLLLYHVLGTDQESDTVVVDLNDAHPTWSYSGEVSHDGKYLLIYFEADLGPNQIHYVDIEKFLVTLQPNPKLVPIVENFQSEFYYITNQNKQNFLFLTNKNAPNWKIVGINFDKPQEQNWLQIVQEDPKFVLEWALPANKNRLVLSYLQDVKSSIQIRSLDGKTSYAIHRLEPGTTYGLYKEIDDHEFFFGFESTITAKQIYRFDFTEHPSSPSLQVYHSTVIPGFEPTDYILTQKFYKSKDGTSVPMFLAYKKDLNLSGETPCLLAGYAGFNSMMLPDFSPDTAMFIRNFNGVYAISNARGGGEYGFKWYDNGRLNNKQNSFDDFNYAAQYLIENNFTSSAKLAITGASNGGLLVAASTNQRPDLFGASIANVGVMDVVRFNKFPAGESWTSDYGNPDNKTQFENLLSYSPLQNVKFPENDNETQYPATLLFTADHDNRVEPSHSYKLIAEMQYKLGTSKRQTNPLFLLVQANAGHGSGKPISKQIDEFTDVFSFLCKALNLKFIN